MQIARLAAAILLLTIGASPSAVAAHGRNIHGVSPATRVLRIPRPDLPSSTAEESFQSCHLFSGFAVVEVESHRKGAEAILLRRGDTTDDSARLCNTKVLSGEASLGDGESYFLGAAGSALFTISAEGSGEKEGFTVYDGKSGKELHTASYHRGKGLVVERKGEKISLQYHSALDLPCVPARNGGPCWKKILKANVVSRYARLRPPDCRRALQSEELRSYPELASLPRAFQIFAPVRVDDVTTGMRHFLDGPTLCNEAP